MKLKLQFGLAEPKREIVWWRTIADFPTLVLFKNKKYEFAMYQPDDTGHVDYICFFSEVQTYDPNYHANVYESIDHLIDPSYGAPCECGAIYTSFPNAHMLYCKKWTKF